MKQFLIISTFICTALSALLSFKMGSGAIPLWYGMPFLGVLLFAVYGSIESLKELP